MREEELKNKIASEVFGKYDCTQILGNIDFSVASKKKADTYLLWAEAKKGVLSDNGILKAICQLILTIGKAKTFQNYFPPKYLGVFDERGISLYLYDSIQQIFLKNDFNWQVTPSNTETREFKELLQLCESLNSTHIEWEDSQAISMIESLISSADSGKIQVTKDNFINVYLMWVKIVKPSINMDWQEAKKQNILDGDLFLADLLSTKGSSIKKNLRAILEADSYTYKVKEDTAVFDTFAKVNFNDNQKAYKSFWSAYTRPPKEEFWSYMINRRDLLIPQDIREVTGAFFTPHIWVEKAHEYLSNALGENWQDDYYIWDCACGTGNLLIGLTNTERVFASTLDQSDVDIIYDNIRERSVNLVKSNVFQMDFLNDGVKEGLAECSKLPSKLREIIKNTPEKIVMLINPPYAEATNNKTSSGTGENREGLKQTKVLTKYSTFMGKASNELYIQFLARLYKEVPNSKIGLFSTLKTLCGLSCKVFRSNFKAELLSGFAVPSWTFDNVKGKFPIGFQIWDCSKHEVFTEKQLDIFSENDIFLQKKNFYSGDTKQRISTWISSFPKSEKTIGFMSTPSPDFQQNNHTRLCATTTGYHGEAKITVDNLVPSMVFLAARKIPEHTWLNDRDQYFAPNKSWYDDKEFQSDCIAWSLFNNNVDSRKGLNNFIPLTEKEVNANGTFESHFMTDFMQGKAKSSNVFDTSLKQALVFSKEAKEVFNCGRKLWSYYMEQKGININAGLYEIKEYFCGRSLKGILQTISDWSDKYNSLIADLKNACKTLARKIEPKFYEHGFLVK